MLQLGKNNLLKFVVDTILAFSRGPSDGQCVKNSKTKLKYHLPPPIRY